MFLGSITALFEIMYYAIIKSQPIGVAQTGLYLFLTLVALIVIFSVRSKDHFRRAPKLSKAMALSFGLVTAISIVTIYIGVTKRLFSFSALPIGILALTVIITIFYVFVLDTVKTWFYKSAVGTNL
jgi:magnesium-transporting ATPase (P-type)